MRSVWKDGKLTLELHRADKTILQKAHAIGLVLAAMHQEAGQSLVDAVNAILKAETE